MFWIFLIAVGVVLTFTTLGAFSVWLKVFAIGLKVAMLVISVLTLAFIWKHFLPRSKTAQNIGG